MSSATSGLNFETQAINAATGANVWTRSYNGPGNGDDRAVAVRVSPDGARVFVTGVSAGSGTGEDFATEALNASTGAVLWTHRYNGPGNGNDAPVGLAVAADGSRVFVTGSSAGASSGTDYATVAYDAATGAPDWTKRFTSAGAATDVPSGLVATEDGKAVVVTGTSPGAATGDDFFTRAYNSATGATLWSNRYNSGGTNTDTAVAIGAAPDSSLIFLTGTIPAASAHDISTFALNATTGARVWRKRFAEEPDNIEDALAVDPDGTKIFLVGHDGLSQFDAAYQAATGTRAWSVEVGPAQGGRPLSAEVTPDGTALIVVGSVDTGAPRGVEFAEGQHRTTTGALFGRSHTWGRRRNDGDDIAFGVAISPDSSTLYMTGESEGTTLDYATVAFSRSEPEPCSAPQWLSG